MLGERSGSRLGFAVVFGVLVTVWPSLVQVRLGGDVVVGLMDYD